MHFHAVTLRETPPVRALLSETILCQSMQLNHKGARLIELTSRLAPFRARQMGLWW